MEPSTQNYEAVRRCLRYVPAYVRSRANIACVRHANLARRATNLRKPTTARSTTAGLRSRPLAEMRSREAQHQGNSTKLKCAEVNRKANVGRAVVCTSKIGFYRLTLELSGGCREVWSLPEWFIAVRLSE
jgi:hypothetical protein